LLLRRCAGSVIVDSQAKPTAITCAVDLHGSSSDTLGYAVLDGILNERLQQQVGNLRSEELGRDIDAHPEPLQSAPYEYRDSAAGTRPLPAVRPAADGNPRMSAAET